MPLPLETDPLGIGLLWFGLVWFGLVAWKDFALFYLCLLPMPLITVSN